MPPKKRKRGGQYKLPPGLRKAQQAKRDAKAAAEAEKPAVESKTEPVSQLVLSPFSALAIAISSESRRFARVCW